MRVWMVVVALATGCGAASDDELPECAVRRAVNCDRGEVTCDLCDGAEPDATGIPPHWAECSDGTHFGPGLASADVSALVDHYCFPCIYDWDTDCPDDGIHTR